MSSGEEIIIYPDYSELKKLLIVSPVFTLFGAFMAIKGFKTHADVIIPIIEYRCHWLVRAMFGIICGLLFRLYGISIAKRLLIKKPSLIIDKEGFTDNTSAVSVGFLKWSEIKEFRVYDFMGQKFLGIEPIDTGQALGKLPIVKKALLNANKAFETNTINIPDSMVSMPLEEVYNKMIQFKNEYQKK